MKRMSLTLGAIALSLLLLGGCVGAAVIYLTAASRNVTLHETCLYGDRRAADGFSVRLENTYGSEDSHYYYYSDSRGGFLNWDTDYIFGEEPQVTTNAWFATEMPKGEFRRSTNPLADDMSQLPNLNATVLEMYGAMEDEAVETGEARRVVSLAEIWDMIPLNIYPDAIMRVLGNVGGDSTILSEFISVLEDELAIPMDPAWEIELTLSMEGDYAIKDYEGTVPGLTSICLATEDSLYIAYFPKKSYMGKDVTLEYLPLEHEKFGIYRLPLERSVQGAVRLDVTGFGQMWESPDGWATVAMEIDPQSGHLLVLGHEGEAYVLCELDPYSGAVLGREVPGAGDYCHLELEEFDPAELIVGEGYAVVRAADAFLCLLERGEDGLLHTTLRVVHDPEASLFEAEAPGWVTSLGTYRYTTHDTYARTAVWYAYDPTDGRLAVFTRRKMGCGFAVAVYRDGALLYHATYESSLDAHGLAGNYECYPRVRWTSLYEY